MSERVLQNISNQNSYANSNIVNDKKTKNSTSSSQSTDDSLSSELAQLSIDSDTSFMSSTLRRAMAKQADELARADASKAASRKSKADRTAAQQQKQKIKTISSNISVKQTQEVAVPDVVATVTAMPEVVPTAAVQENREAEYEEESADVEMDVEMDGNTQEEEEEEEELPVEEEEEENLPVQEEEEETVMAVEEEEHAMAVEEEEEQVKSAAEEEEETDMALEEEETVEVIAEEEEEEQVKAAEAEEEQEEEDDDNIAVVEEQALDEAVDVLAKDEDEKSVAESGSEQEQEQEIAEDEDDDEEEEAESTATQAAAPSTPDRMAELSELKVVELRAELKRAGLMTTGRKAVLVERLAHLPEMKSCGRAARSLLADRAREAYLDELMSSTPPSQMRVVDLKEGLQQLGLAATGRKAELCARLQQGQASSLVEQGLGVSASGIEWESDGHDLLGKLATIGGADEQETKGCDAVVVGFVDVTFLALREDGYLVELCEQDAIDAVDRYNVDA